VRTPLSNQTAFHNHYNESNFAKTIINQKIYIKDNNLHLNDLKISNQSIIL